MPEKSSNPSAAAVEDAMKHLSAHTKRGRSKKKDSNPGSGKKAKGNEVDETCPERKKRFTLRQSWAYHHAKAAVSVAGAGGRQCTEQRRVCRPRNPHLFGTRKVPPPQKNTLLSFVNPATPAQASSSTPTTAAAAEPVRCMALVAWRVGMGMGGGCAPRAASEPVKPFSISTA